MGEVEGVSVHHANVLSRLQDLHIINQIEKLPITLVTAPRHDRDPIIELIPKAIGSIIDNDDIPDFPVQEYSKVFDEESLDHDTVIPVESMVDEFVGGV